MKPPSGPFAIRAALARPAPPAPRPEAGAGGRLLRRQGGQSQPPDFGSLAGEGEAGHMAGGEEKGGIGEFCTAGGRKKNIKGKKKKTLVKSQRAPNFVNEPPPSAPPGRWVTVWGYGRGDGAGNELAASSCPLCAPERGQGTQSSTEGCEAARSRRQRARGAEPHRSAL